MTRTPLYLITVMLIIAGVSLAWLRHVQTGEPYLPGEQAQVWQVEARINFIGDGATSVNLALPENNPRYRLFNEQAASPGYGFSIIKQHGRRHGEWTKRDTSGRQTVYYKAEFVARSKPQSLKPNDIKVRPVFWQEPEATAASQLLDLVLKKSSSTASLVRELVKALNNPDPDQNAALLLAHQSSKAQLLVTLLNQAGVAARTVLGIQLEDARRQQPLTPMVRVQSDSEGMLIDPSNGKVGLPDNFLLWNSNENGLLDVAGAHDSSISFSMIKRTIPAQHLARQKNDNSLFSLLGVHLLPIEAQGMFKMLFLLPIGALVVVFMRLLIGVKTSGTFMPILISLAFLQTTLIPGLVSFILIVALGLVIRSYLSYLNLLMVARIATLIVLVITIIAFMSLISYELGLSTGITITFFPMIIIAWTIERMSILWEEEGPGEVLQQGFGSLFVAVLSYLLMTTPIISHLTFNFPEINLIVIALILLMGQYTGYRLSELRRFRDLAKEMDHAD